MNAYALKEYVSRGVGVMPGKGMHRKDVVAAVRKRNITLVQLALANDLSRSAIHYALLKPSKRAEEVLATFLGLSPAVIWPDRYDADGNRTVTRGRRGRRASTKISAYRKAKGQ